MAPTRGREPGSRAGASLAQLDAPDEDLVARLRAGDEVAFGALVARHRPWLVRLCTRLLGSDAHAAEDAAQESLLKLHAATRRDARPLRVRPWLAVVARNTCVDEQRRRRADLPGVLPDRPGPDEDPFQLDPALAQAWSRLAGRHREVLYLREVIGLSYKEIAGVMDLTLPAVETLVFRARAALRREYERTGGDRFGCGLLGLYLVRLGRGDRQSAVGKHAAACTACGRAVDSVRVAEVLGGSAPASDTVISAARAGLPSAAGNPGLGSLPQRVAQMLSSSLPGGEQAVAKLLSTAAGVMMAAASVLPAAVPFAEASRPAIAAAAASPERPAGIASTGRSVAAPVPAGTGPVVAGAMPAAKPVSLRTMMGNSSPGGTLPRRDRESAIAPPAPSATRSNLATPMATPLTPERPAAPAPPVDRHAATSKLPSALLQPSAPVKWPEAPDHPGQRLLASVPSPKPEPAPSPPVPHDVPAPPPVPHDVPAPPPVPDPPPVSPGTGGGGLRLPGFLAR